jgi:hypothetical protein
MSADSDEGDHLFRRKTTTGRSEATDGALVYRSGRLGCLQSSWFPLSVYSSSRLCVAVKIPGRGPGGRDFQRVWEGPGAGGWVPGAFHTRADSTAGVGGFWEGGGGRRRGAPRPPQEEVSTAGMPFFLRIDSPLSGS